MSGTEEFVFDPEDLAVTAGGPVIRARDSGRGVRIDDPIMGVRTVFSTPGDVDPRPLGTTELADRFTFPVDTGSTVRTPAITFPRRLNVWVRDEAATLVAEVASRGDATVPPGRWNLELDVSGLKVYLAVDGGVTVSQRTHETVLRFAPDRTPPTEEGGPGDREAVEVAIGSRSYHSRPAGIVTVPHTPAGVMRGLSTFGSALKTHSAERSFPTLRGHPPLLQFGEAFDTNGGVETPDTGVTLTVPASFERVFPLASLAYYLGATVRPGPPAVHADGITRALDTVDRSAAVRAHRPESVPQDAQGVYETAVRDTLRHLFVLDTVVRTVGYYDVPLAERAAIEDALSLSLPEAYDAPLAERTAAYLAVPQAVTAPAWPHWRLTATVPALPGTARYLPFLADDLAMVRIAGTTTDASSPRTSAALGETGGQEVALPARGTRRGCCGDDADATDGDGDEDAREDGPTSRGLVDSEDIVTVPAAPESLTQTWIGDGIPRGASKASLESYARQIRRAGVVPDGDARISVAVVCNDEEMSDELDVSEIYGVRDVLTFDIERHVLTDRETLAGVFESDVDFVHYIGHVEETGLQCADGFLSAESIGTVGVESFLLNACKSFRPGQKLVDKGAHAGVVTLTDVINQSATLVGRTLARILNAGYPLQLAVDVLGEDLFSAQQYIVLGNGNTELVKAASGTPVLFEIDSAPDGRFDATVSAYPSHSQGMGSFYVPFVGGNRTAYLNCGTLDTFRVTGAELDETLTLEDFPVRVPGTPGLRWSDELTASDLRDLLGE